ncbi:N-6 DNA methylase [Pseudomonas sp. PA-6-1D]|uniref:type I restriction-modification system subunit M n=1 Tax=Pseudomonas TaxID=286 RepID=UPI001EF12C1B|nr:MULTISPECIES: class I SAM-dependent DNA methyltransferase [Pseudomonas]MCF5144401.1 N-6 DNA methylase [Pseudomonas sp. PA-6-3C]MCF5148723.1 N-6 DNA methylase [Pseudomonas sp. PA-6-3F]MCF5160419.1 N-6 DNA methylase [Pseudomonas sp. PA-6-2E]MCF5176695.1 N-6 DNA methylase [Pseudomonas sp. PA-6-1D]MCF5194272.1 N-6 DNA methylase [Pseudomonas sp. PA-6-1H]
MASTEANTSDFNYADTLWKAADTLRGQVDAAEYKHVVLGLLFLKYVSDSFDSRRDDLRAELTSDGIQGEQLERLLESRDEYTAERVFWVPPEARWSNLQNQATRPDIATLIDDAILAVERDNTNLKGKLPRDYARRGIEPVKMKGLIDLIAGIGFKGSRGKARDTLGRVYEYFLGKFAAAEGKLGGEFYTPRSVVRVLVEMLEPYEGRIYDPACGSGGMFVQSEKFVESHGGQRTDVSIFGQESNPTTWRLAHMNLAIHGIEAKLGELPADTLLRDQHPDLKADFVLANPPFNVSDWSGQLLRGDKRWTYGAPPVGNANYAWIQHFIQHLAYPNGKGGGVAGFVMANGSLSSNTSGEGDIRRKIIEDDLVDCIVALPAQLFFTTGIPVCLWFLTRDKTGRNIRRGTPNRSGGRSGETLFIDARKLGTMQTRVLRTLTGVEDAECVQGTGDPLPTSDIGRIVYTYRRWRGEPAPDWWDESEYGLWAFEPIPGFAKAATLEEIAKHGHVLTPGRYVGAEEQEEDAETFAEKYPRLVAELEEHLTAGERLSSLLRLQLALVEEGGGKQ